MTPETIKVVMEGLSFLFSILAMIIAIFRTRQSKVDERFKSGSDRMDRHDSRLQAVEQTVKALPSSQDIHKIELMMAEMSGTLGRMDAVMEGNAKIMGRLETIVTRHEDHLLSSGK
ncbi:MAG: DUF2730 family protein [Pelagimonas sp.]|uniref:DUF2730 family protein n=1 Tax=Pelagimonas sp. TaxID=2073170 RepID=UPI003D6BFEC6